MSKETRPLHYLDIAEVGELVRRRAASSQEITRAQLDRIAALDASLHAYAAVMADAALAQAAAADAEIAAGRVRGPLHGVPIAVKDVCDVEGVPTGGGMAPHRQAVAAARDATVVRRLREAGAVLIGKPQLTEGAYSDHHPSVRPPLNPWNPDYWTGISSSGSAVAVAAGMAYGSLASDTGGSIRWPAAANNLTGLKPTWGRVSRHGVFELAASLDHVGTLTRSARDAAILLAAIAGSDPDDPTTLLDEVPDFRAAAEDGAGLPGLRIGVDAAWNGDGVDPATRAVLAQAIEVFADLGAEMVDVRFPDVAQALADWVPNCAVEAAVAHRAGYPALKASYGPVLAGVIDAGRTLPGVAYQEILLRRMAFRGRVNRLFLSVDLMLTPVQPFDPLTLERIRTLGEQPELIAALQRYTCPFNLSGHPSLTLPGGGSETGMPIGFQLIARHLGEATLLRAGAAYQRATAWHRRHPTA